MDHPLREGAGEGTFAAGRNGRVVIQWADGTGPGPEPEAGGLVRLDGDAQRAEAGSYFGSPLVAQVLQEDEPHAGVGGVPVTFTIQGSTGSRFAASDDPGVRVAANGTSVTVSTNALGVATTPRIVAGPAVGAFQVHAQADGVARGVDFGLEVFAGAATGLQIESGDGQSAAPYTAFDHNLRVTVRNSAGLPVQGAEVTFTIQGPTGSRFATDSHVATALTDASGLAGTPRIMAGDSGPVTVIAQIAGGSQVAFHLTVTGDVHRGLSPVTGAPR
jgi:hypothetical protein